MEKYRGMRWLKCDLQMQTPADAQHWLGEKLNPGEEAVAAQAFAEACYQTRLDVVGITDHNFLSKDFIPYLRDAFNNIEQTYNHKITLFPGFEFEADVGKGMHVLCLFEPGTTMEDIDHILTECGVSRPRIEANKLAKSTKRLPDILNIVQKQKPDGTWRGIVIVPHVFEDSLFDNDRISEWLQQEEFCNPDLLAVEVPKHVSSMNANFQKLFRSGDDCLEDWKRIRPIATLMSSDNKKLIDKDKNQKPTPNSIGYRYSWIKMSSPSIESLRQAFLDHQSRIILPTDISTDTNPAHRSKHATIKSISIKNVAFLDNQEIHFSSNLNCVIGGRGSGKSTLLEYLRIVFGKDELKDIDSGTKERIQRVRGTLNDPHAEVEVCWVSAHGVEDHIAWQNNKPTVQGREMADPVTFFNSLPLHFYSQQQLNRLTDSEPDAGSVRQAQRLLELVDGFMKSQLDVLAEQEQMLKQKIKDAFSDLHRVNALENDYKRLQQECQELDRQWKARSEIQEDAHRHQLLKTEARYFEVLAGAQGQQVGDITVLAETIAASHIPFQATGSTHAVWIQNFDRKVKTAKDLLAQKIREAVNQYESVIEELKVADPAWHVIQAELDLADANFEDACAAKGLTTDDVGRLQEINQARSIKQRELGATETEIQRLRKAVGDINNLMGQLHLIWREQFQKRVLAAERANEGSVLNEGGQRFITVTAKYQNDLKSFNNLWTSFCPPDKRTTLARQWVELGEKLFSNFIVQSHHASPWELLEHYIATHDPFVLGSQTRQEYTLAEYIYDNPADWERLRCSRIKDTVDMQLFRSDGSVAGSIAEGTLSDGQRNTAALALLLAQGGGPLVIDQPEDELDSNFVFRELIPMLRKVKSNRQIIMATHNANLPVNGDAELVYAFDAQNGKGRKIACGGLDQPTVTKAVLDIMEGTEEAFRRRREKYHF